METNNQTHGPNCDCNKCDTSCNNCGNCGKCGTGRIVPNWVAQGLGGLLIALVALLIVQKGHETINSFKNQKSDNTISVSGTGKVTATPNMATIQLGVVTDGDNAEKVKNENNEKVNKVVAYAKAQGISEADIKTSQYTFTPKYQYIPSTNEQIIDGYNASQTVTVKVRGVDKSKDVLNKILDGAVNNGANQVYANDLSVENPTDLQNSAKKLAIEDAKKKAQQLADAAGLKLGKIVSLYESPSPIMAPYYAYDNMSGIGGSMEKSMAPDIQVGTQDISETMTVMFELK